MDKEKQSKWAALWQFIKFSLVGVSNNLISEGGYAVFIFFKMNYLLASFISFSISVVNAYYWNSRYVFGDKKLSLKKKETGESGTAAETETGQEEVRETASENGWKVFGKTYLAYFWGYLVHAALLVLWVDIVHISQWMGPIADWFAAHDMARVDAKFLGELIAAGVNLIITVPMNFFINKFWVYKKKK